MQVSFPDDVFELKTFVTKEAVEAEEKTEVSYTRDSLNAKAFWISPPLKPTHTFFELINYLLR